MLWSASLRHDYTTLLVTSYYAYSVTPAFFLSVMRWK
jgi:hypothetical protein